MKALFVLLLVIEISDAALFVQTTYYNDAACTDKFNYLAPVRIKVQAGCQAASSGLMSYSDVTCDAAALTAGMMVYLDMQGGKNADCAKEGGAKMSINRTTFVPIYTYTTDPDTNDTVTTKTVGLPYGNSPLACSSGDDGCLSSLTMNRLSQCNPYSGTMYQKMECVDLGAAPATTTPVPTTATPTTTRPPASSSSSIVHGGSTLILCGLSVATVLMCGL